VPVWHVSGSWRSGQYAIPVEVYTPTDQQRLRRRLLTALEGVGDPVTWWTVGEYVVHLRRPLTATEQDATPPGWCAIPAHDLAGGVVLDDWPSPPPGSV
jgi:hypothetical protein